MIVCCDDTLLFNTNISLELFEYFKTLKIFEKEDIKNLMIKNVDAIFYNDFEYKNSFIKEIKEKY